MKDVDEEEAFTSFHNVLNDIRATSLQREACDIYRLLDLISYDKYSYRYSEWKKYYTYRYLYWYGFGKNKLKFKIVSKEENFSNLLTMCSCINSWH